MSSRPGLSDGDAMAAVLKAITDLTTRRGHTIGQTVRDDPGTTAMQCRLCDRWIVVCLNGQADAPGISGQALSYCKGKRWGPVATTDNGLQAALEGGRIS